MTIETICTSIVGACYGVWFITGVIRRNTLKERQRIKEAAEKASAAAERGRDDSET